MTWRCLLIQSLVIGEWLLVSFSVFGFHLHWLKIPSIKHQFSKNFLIHKWKNIRNFWISFIVTLSHCDLFGNWCLEFGAYCHYPSPLTNFVTVSQSRTFLNPTSTPIASNETTNPPAMIISGYVLRIPPNIQRPNPPPPM